MNVNVFLHPHRFNKNPIVNAPVKPPIETIDPIQDISWIVNGPDTSGVCSDISTGNAGEYHPKIHPCENIKKFTEI